LSTSTSLGPAATATADYLLVDSRNSFPYALDNVQELAFLRLAADQEFWNESTVKLVGLLYEVSDETLARLDMLEGHPNFYRRKKIALADGSDAIAYLLHEELTRKFIAEDPDRYKRVEDGNWKRYWKREYLGDPTDEDAEVPPVASPGPAAAKTDPSDSPPSPPRLVRSKSFTAALREICAELFVVCDKNRNGFLERDEYRKVTKTVYSLFLPEVRARWEWKQMDVDKDEKVSLSEWLSGTEAIANLAGEEKFLTALRKWAKQEKSNQLHKMIDSEIARKKAEGEPFEAPDSAKLKPPFS
jgi:gamma-glutamylcyclotransferase (GGCT)/AIG2-like uncharacterized protein YtfP